MARIRPATRIRLSAAMVSGGVASSITGTGAFNAPTTTLAGSGTVSSSGDLVHGSSFTVTGTGFGAKSGSAPDLWDYGQAADGSLDPQWSAGWPNAGTSNYVLKNRTSPFNSISAPHSNISRFIAGCHGDSAGSNQGYNVIPFVTYTAPGSTYYSYWSYYTRSDPNWVFNLGSPPDDNYKTFAFSEGGSPYELPNCWYIAHNTDSFESNTPASGYGWIINDDGSSLAFPDQLGGTRYHQNALNPFHAANGWIKTEVEIFRTSGTNGYVRQWENGELVVDYNGPTDSYAGTTRTEGLGGYARGYGNANQWRYFADVYHDRQTGNAGRFVLANNATLASANIAEVQPWTSITTTSANLVCNKGRHSSGTVHLHYVDSVNGDQYIGTRTLA